MKLYSPLNEGNKNCEAHRGVNFYTVKILEVNVSHLTCPAGCTLLYQADWAVDFEMPQGFQFPSSFWRDAKDPG